MKATEVINSLLRNDTWRREALGLIAKAVLRRGYDIEQEDLDVLDIRIPSSFESSVYGFGLPPASSLIHNPEKIKYHALDIKSSIFEYICSSSFVWELCFEEIANQNIVNILSSHTDEDYILVSEIYLAEDTENVYSSSSQFVYIVPLETIGKEPDHFFIPLDELTNTGLAQFLTFLNKVGFIADEDEEKEKIAGDYSEKDL